MIYRDKHKENYTVMSNSILNRKDLSWKAKGILCFLLSNKDDANFNHQWIQAMATDSKMSVRSGIDELKGKGYIRIVKVAGEHGKIKYEWFVFESPCTD